MTAVSRIRTPPPEKLKANWLFVDLNSYFASVEQEADDETLNDRNRVTAALDHLNRRYGHHAVYLGAIHNARKEAPTRIPFGPPPALDEF